MCCISSHKTNRNFSEDFDNLNVFIIPLMAPNSEVFYMSGTTKNLTNLHEKLLRKQSYQGLTAWLVFKRRNMNLNSGLFSREKTNWNLHLEKTTYFFSGVSIDSSNVYSSAYKWQSFQLLGPLIIFFLEFFQRWSPWS